MSRLEHYMAFMKLPPELQLRINNYYQARYGGKWFNEKHVMDTVSSALKEVITRYLLPLSGLLGFAGLPCFKATFFFF